VTKDNAVPAAVAAVELIAVARHRVLDEMDVAFEAIKLVAKPGASEAALTKHGPCQTKEPTRSPSLPEDCANLVQILSADQHADQLAHGVVQKAQAATKEVTSKLGEGVARPTLNYSMVATVRRTIRGTRGDKPVEEMAPSEPSSLSISYPRRGSRAEIPNSIACCYRTTQRSVHPTFRAVSTTWEISARYALQ
jgi:hypothetical protein